MTLFGSSKAAKNYIKTREEDAISKLNKKLEKETKRRVGAEKEVGRLKKEVKRLNGLMTSFTGGSPTH